MPENRDSIPLSIDFGSIGLFRIILYTALTITGGYAVFEILYGSDEKAVFDGLMFIGFAIAVILVNRGVYTRVIIHLSVGVGVIGLLSMLTKYNEILLWTPAVAVPAFALLGKRGGVYWIITIALGLLSALMYDHFLGEHLYSLKMSVTSMLSYTIIMLIVYFYFMKAEEQALALLKETARRERLEMAKMLAGGIAHLINNEMQSIISRASLLKMKAPIDMMGDLEKIEKTGFSASRHVNELLAFAKGGKYQLEVLNIGELLEFALNRIRKKMPDSSVAINLQEVSVQQSCKGDPDQLRQALVNIIENAIEASSEGGNVAIMVDNVELRSDSDTKLVDGNYLVVSVLDEGEGIPKASLDKIFDPFFSTKFTGRGLGLAAVFGIIKNHGGKIEVESQEGEGTTFRVWLRAEMENEN